ncbi:hypothetical protein FB451DRAFT_1190042 [Mycena latifolia]|nr:hypothetical protein FB451DRAFT_1190042 [Mycena latifolia]
MLALQLDLRFLEVSTRRSFLHTSPTLGPNIFARQRRAAPAPNFRLHVSASGERGYMHASLNVIYHIPPSGVASSIGIAHKCQDDICISGFTPHTSHEQPRNIIEVPVSGVAPSSTFASQPPPTLCLHSRRIQRAPDSPERVCTGSKSPPRRDPPDAPGFLLRYLTGPRMLHALDASYVLYHPPNARGISTQFFVVPGAGYASVRAPTDQRRARGRVPNASNASQLRRAAQGWFDFRCAPEFFSDVMLDSRRAPPQYFGFNFGVPGRSQAFLPAGGELSLSWPWGGEQGGGGGLTGTRGRRWLSGGTAALGGGVCAVIRAGARRLIIRADGAGAAVVHGGVRTVLLHIAVIVAGLLCSNGEGDETYQLSEEAYGAVLQGQEREKSPKTALFRALGVSPSPRNEATRGAVRTGRRRLNHRVSIGVGRDSRGAPTHKARQRAVDASRSTDEKSDSMTPHAARAGAPRSVPLRLVATTTQRAVGRRTPHGVRAAGEEPRMHDSAGYAARASRAEAALPTDSHWHAQGARVLSRSRPVALTKLARRCLSGTAEPEAPARGGSPARIDLLLLAYVVSCSLLSTR